MPPRRKAKPAGKSGSVTADSSSSTIPTSTPTVAVTVTTTGSKRKPPAARLGRPAKAQKTQPHPATAANAEPAPKPAESKPARATKPAAPKQAKQSKPAAPKSAKPAAPKSAKPAAPKSVKPAAPKSAKAKPVAPKSANPAATKQEATVPVPKPDRGVKPARKRAHARPEYEETWKEVYLAGTEWDQLQLVYSIDWDFDHLDEALTDGNLTDKKVFLFGATEPQLLMRDENDQKGDVIPVPVIVAVVTDTSPPSTVGIKSVQRAEEEIVPMSDLRMGWHAYAPENVSLSRRFKPNVHVLKCNERKARLRNMGESEVHKYDYVLPYFIRPDQIEDVTEDTVVQVLAELEGRKAPLMCEYDYEMDELEEFVEEQIKENELDSEKHTEALKKAIRDAEKATKLRYKAEREERKRRIDAISLEAREAIKNMKLLKFYPLNDWPDVSKIKSPFINRYYGRATEVL